MKEETEDFLLLFLHIFPIRYSITERLTSMEYICKNACADAMIDGVDFKVACRFDSTLAPWEKTSEDIQP